MTVKDLTEAVLCAHEQGTADNSVPVITRHERSDKDVFELVKDIVSI